jgi:hypothetical protein
MPVLASALVLVGHPAGAAVLPNSSHQIVVFPARDMVTLTGYSTNDRVTVELWHNGALFAASGPTTPEVDPRKPSQLGQVLVNHPPVSANLACWQPAAPAAALVGGFASPTSPFVGSLDTGDVIVVRTAAGTERTLVANIRVTQPATDVGGGTVLMRGTATTDRAGTTPLPLASLEARIVANKQAFAVNGRRDLRTGKDGFTFAFDRPGSVTWTATFGGLSAGDVALAVVGQSRALWRNDPVNPTEQTIFEANLVAAGPQAPCAGAGTLP